MYSNKVTSASTDRYVNETSRDLSPLFYQASHGFSVGQVLYRKSDSTFALANATTSDTAEVIGIVTKVKSANRFTIVQSGEVILTLANFTEGVLPADGATCYLSTTDGKLTVTEPNVVGQVSKPIVVITGISGTKAKGMFFNMRGVTVGGSNLYTQIGLSNNTNTTIQNVSNFPNGSGGRLEGFIKIDATVDYVFTFTAYFTKNAAGTDYEASYLFGAGDKPDGTVINADSSGNVFVTLPDISGFVSASAVFCMHGAAVGTQLPVNISPDRISGAADLTMQNGQKIIVETLQAVDGDGIFIQDNVGNKLISLTNRTKYNTYRYINTVAVVNQYVHFKTNIPKSDNLMMFFKFLGYEYGATTATNKPIDANLVFYAYSGSSTPFAVGSNGTHPLSVYYSTDLFAVVTIYVTSTYFLGLNIDIHQPCGSLKSDVAITASTNSSSATGVY